jgi:hypothetical protein
MIASLLHVWFILYYCDVTRTSPKYNLLGRYPLQIPVSCSPPNVYKSGLPKGKHSILLAVVIVERCRIPGGVITPVEVLWLKYYRNNLNFLHNLQAVLDIRQVDLFGKAASTKVHSQQNKEIQLHCSNGNGPALPIAIGLDTRCSVVLQRYICSKTFFLRGGRFFRSKLSCCSQRLSLHTAIK